MFRFPSLVVAFLCSVLSLPAVGQGNSQRGAAVGGIMGAIAGGVIGENNDEAGAGALIGGVLGALTGASLGEANDREQAYARQESYLRQQTIARQHQAYREAVSANDVVNMSRNGINDSVIINQIRQRGIQRKLEVPEIIALHQQGVSHSVITAMQNASSGPIETAYTEVHAPVVVQQAPSIIVHRKHYRPYCGRSHRHHHRSSRHHRRSHGPTFRFSIP